MPDGDLGYYSHEERRIYFNLRCTPAERRSVVAHELGHAYYGHEGEYDSMSEYQADLYAATLLVEPGAYADLERINSHAEWIAEELNVTADVIHDYRRYCLQRVGNVTYVRPRMGAGQWAYRHAWV